MKNKKKIVCFGGGNAMPKAVLSGLKKYSSVSISAICAMLDSGGSSGRLREDYNITAPGDIRRAFIALANTSPIIETLFNYRFETGELKGHNFANLFITALELSFDNPEEMYDQIHKMLNIPHKVLPITLDNSQLFARLENGKVISGETNIDIPKHNSDLKIKEVFLKPKAKIYPKALKEIQNADLIVIGPGDLYSSLAQILLVEGAAKAILDSKAKKVYVCNLMTKEGETNHFNVQDFTNKIESLLGGKVDYVLYNTEKPKEKPLQLKRKKHPELMNMVSYSSDLDKSKFIGKDFLEPERINHDPNKLSKSLLSLI
jgi:uncharacterized cofD-like protein